MKQPISVKFCLIIGLLASSHAFAAPNCSDIYLDGAAPIIVNKSMMQYTKQLCYSAYATMYSGMARAPLWSAQKLTPSSTRDAIEIKRSEDFRENELLVEDWRNLLSDFRNSGYDRGHVAPAADMPTDQASSESFLMSNIIAQDQELNRNLWAAIEKGVRRLSEHKTIHVFTGPLWIGPEVNWLRARVMVPTHLYKLVYDPNTDAAAAYLVENKARASHREISLAELEHISGISFLPTRSPKILKLPKPRY